MNEIVNVPKPFAFFPDGKGTDWKEHGNSYDIHMVEYHRANYEL